ncbi:delta-60 repeat domain-containing protein [Micromonospora soli]|uniref:delta-60 repeat domain-containing protein n=1 Tax=Micromonospora sp. NBRC 110009 TaxID=3061627 RepID=UPI002673F231|nr:delta-60 repeat domain-containing protein [Micromonospora sp. NBRC 110009]WKT98875.1 delta-60 repeat domain-containing protein [Micromonospora sp. NBRC 110009]
MWRRWCAAIAAPVLAVGLLAAPARAANPTPVTSTLTSANPVDTTPHAQNGDTKAFAEIGNTVYVGGSFTSVKAAGDASWTTRNYLFAYDRATGALKTGFNPVLDGAVHALAVSPDGKLIVGGAFLTVNGVSRKNLVELDPTTGATVTSWVGRSDGGLVRRTLVVGNSLYLAGAFHWVNGTQHSLLARLDATTGAIDASFQIDASVARTSSELVWGLAVSPDSRTLVAVGNFTQVNGQARNQVVLVDLAGTPAVANWSTQHYVAPCSSAAFPFYARDVDFSDDSRYFVIVADGGRADAGAYCDATARFETADRGAGIDATWVNYTGSDSVTSVEVADNVVYVGGHFRWLNNANGNDSAGSGAINRFGLGALDPINGLPLVWNPTRSGAPSGTTTWGPIIWELWRGSTGLYAGFDSDGVGNEYHGRMGLFPLSGGRTVPAVNAPNAASGYLYVSSADGQATKVPFNGSTLGTPVNASQPNLTAAGASFSLGNKLYWSKTDAAAPNGSYLDVSIFSGGAVGAPWVSSGYNDWFKAGSMTGAFALDGRMYYTKAGSNSLFYRYLEPDGYILGCTEFTLPSVGVPWGTVRGLAWVNGKVVYGDQDGSLHAVPFDGAAVDGAASVELAAPGGAVNWSSRTLFFATS